jgi:hypothetical protein
MYYAEPLSARDSNTWEPFCATWSVAWLLALAVGRPDSKIVAAREPGAQAAGSELKAAEAGWVHE